MADHVRSGDRFAVAVGQLEGGQLVEKRTEPAGVRANGHPVGTHCLPAECRRTDAIGHAAMRRPPTSLALFTPLAAQLTV